jgi:hypothetical protein
MKTRIIAAFPGTGKTHFVASLDRKDIAVDLDTSLYTDGYATNSKARNDQFPYNYIRSIKDTIGKTSLLFIGCQPEVLNLLRQENISFVLIYPGRQLKEEYINRLYERGNSRIFIKLISDNWDQFLDYLEQQDCGQLVLGQDQYISDVIK